MWPKIKRIAGDLVEIRLGSLIYHVISEEGCPVLDVKKFAPGPLVSGSGAVSVSAEERFKILGMYRRFRQKEEFNC